MDDKIKDRENIKISALPINRFNEVGVVTERAFNIDFFSTSVSKEYEFNYKNIRTLFDKNRIVSVVIINFRQMFIEDVTFNLGGVGGVSTLPEYRKRGYASR